MWLRRVYFDLIGLPPTPAEIEAFLADRSPIAFEKVVDRLLASPHFGERWGRHWLDLVRYAETFGHEFDPPIPNAHQYRDYVIRALNADVPYDQFVREHVAGDLIKPRLNPAGGFNESILGTGFWFFGEQVHSPVDIRGDEADRIDNKIDVFGKTFLALTVSCARCHDHKFDAISQKDYYALSGFILSSSYRQVRFDSIENNKRIAKELEELRDARWPPVLHAFAAAVQPNLPKVADRILRAAMCIQNGKPAPSTEVERWVAYLKKAAEDESNPFYELGIICTLPKEKLVELCRNNERELKRLRGEDKQTLEERVHLLSGGDRRTWFFDDASYVQLPWVGYPFWQKGA